MDSWGPGGYWFMKKTWSRKSRVRLPLNLFRYRLGTLNMRLFSVVFCCNLVELSLLTASGCFVLKTSALWWSSTFNHHRDVIWRDYTNCTGRILGRNWDLRSFPPCYSLSPLYQQVLITPPPPPRAKVVCNINIVFRNLQSEIMPWNLNDIVLSWIRPWRILMSLVWVHGLWVSIRCKHITRH